MADEVGFPTGPYVSVATFVDKVLEEKDGVLSLIRVVNELQIEASGPEAPDELPPGMVQPLLALTLRAGEALGPQTLQIVLETPEGGRHPGPENSLNFPSGKHATINIVTPMQFAVETAGLYWADVMINGRLMTRVPLNIQYGFMR